jgi:hypothetical protein
MSIAAKTTLTTTETMSNGPRRINLFYCIGTFGQMQKGKGACPKRVQKRRLKLLKEFLYGIAEVKEWNAARYKIARSRAGCPTNPHPALSATLSHPMGEGNNCFDALPRVALVDSLTRGYFPRPLWGRHYAALRAGRNCIDQEEDYDYD